MRNNVALIGFMGTGKSTIGKALAKKIGLDFVEIDSRVEERSGKTISLIFKNEGESVFRQMESEITSEVSQCEKTVIACGGGIVLNPQNIEHLRKNAVIVYLQADPQIILRRVKQSTEIRPLLEVDDPFSTINNLLKFRQPLYEQAADITIETSNVGIDDIVDDIIAKLDKNESVNLKK